MKSEKVNLKNSIKEAREDSKIKNFKEKGKVTSKEKKIDKNLHNKIKKDKNNSSENSPREFDNELAHIKNVTTEENNNKKENILNVEKSKSQEELEKLNIKKIQVRFHF